MYILICNIYPFICLSIYLFNFLFIYLPGEQLLERHDGGGQLSEPLCQQEVRSEFQRESKFKKIIEWNKGIQIV